MTSQTLNETQIEPRFVKSADGTVICADAVGNRSAEAPVIVLIHGLSMVKAVFDPIFTDSEWTSNVFLVRYDARGHGRSGMPVADEAWESKRISEDFEAVCEEFNVREAFVLAWSLGATHLVDIINYNTTISISGYINIAGPLYNDKDIFGRIASQEVMEILGGLVQPPSVDSFLQTILEFIPLLSDRLSQEFFRVILEGIVLQPRVVTTELISRDQSPEKLLREVREGKLDLPVEGTN